MPGIAALNRYVRRSIYPAPPPVAVRPPAGAELVRTRGPDPAFAVYYPAPAGAHTVVYFHGNGEQIGDVDSLLAPITAAGLGFVAVEYPGYGPAADQTLGEANLYAAASRMLDHLRDAYALDAGQTVLLGHSLGAAVAVEMATRGYGHRLVLSAPFTSTSDMVRHMSRYLPARLLAAGDPMDSLAKAPSVHIPTLLIHGSEDTAVPASMSATLAGRLPRAYRVVLPGRGHNDVDDAVVRAAVVAATEPPEHWAAAMQDPSPPPG